MVDNIWKFLRDAADAYYQGHPFISDAEFDSLADKYKYETVGAHATSGNKGQHQHRLYSLDKVYDDEESPLVKYPFKKIETPKLDGAAISLLYVDGNLVKVLTRGDGIEGDIITEKFYNKAMVPLTTAIGWNSTDK